MVALAFLFKSLDMKLKRKKLFYALSLTFCAFPTFAPVAMVGIPVPNILLLGLVMFFDLSFGALFDVFNLYVSLWKWTLGSFALTFLISFGLSQCIFFEKVRL